MSFLDTIELLSPLTAEERSELANFCQERMINQGEVLFSEGDDANAMYILKVGSVNIYKSIDGKQVFLGVVQAQEILGEMALFVNEGKRMGTGIVAENATVITLLSFSIKKLAEKNPVIMSKIQRIIDERVTKNKITESKFKGI